MTDKDLKNIYEYMGWEEEKPYWWCAKCKSEIGGYNVTHYETCDICGFPVITKGGDKPLDSNSAWEVVQEMERREDLRVFVSYTLDNWLHTDEEIGSTLYYLNPTNFFNCFAKWLEEREVKK